MPKVVITFEKGERTVEVDGVKGASCTDITKLFSDMEISETKIKDEFYEEPLDQSHVLNQ